MPIFLTRRRLAGALASILAVAAVTTYPVLSGGRGASARRIDNVAATSWDLATFTRAGVRGLGGVSGVIDGLLFLGPLDLGVDLGMLPEGEFLYLIFSDDELFFAAAGGFDVVRGRITLDLDEALLVEELAGIFGFLADLAGVEAELDFIDPLVIRGTAVAREGRRGQSLSVALRVGFEAGGTSGVTEFVTRGRVVTLGRGTPAE